MKDVLPGSLLTKVKKLLQIPFLICAHGNALRMSWGSEYSKERERTLSINLEYNGSFILNLGCGRHQHVSPAAMLSHVHLTIANANYSVRFRVDAPNLYNSDYFLLFLPT